MRKWLPNSKITAAGLVGTVLALFSPWVQSNWGYDLGATLDGLVAVLGAVLAGYLRANRRPAPSDVTASKAAAKK